MSDKKPTRQQKKILKLIAGGCWIELSSSAGVETVSIRDGLGINDDRMWTTRKTIRRLRQNEWIDCHNNITEAGREAAGLQP